MPSQRAMAHRIQRRQVVARIAKPVRTSFLHAPDQLKPLLDENPFMHLTAEKRTPMASLSLQKRKS